MDSKESKLRSQFRSTAGPQQSTIFSGVCVHVNGRTRPPLEELRALVLQHGGSFEQYYHSHLVTHVLCTHVARSKWVNGPREWREKLTRPEWVVDSVREGRLLDWRKYRLMSSDDSSNSGGDRNVQLKLSESSQDEKQVIEEELDDVGDAGDAGDEDGESGVDLLLGLMDTEPSDECINENIDECINGNIDKRINGNINECINENIDESTVVANSLSANINNDSPPPYPPPHPTTTAKRLTSESPGFLQEFYRNSRLHHLSRWREEAKQLVKTLTAAAAAARKRTKNDCSNAKNNNSNWLTLHVDLDCFFVAVSCLSYRKGNDDELLDDANVPMAVSHALSHSTAKSNFNFNFNSSSDISSCNYAARSFGIRNGMYLGEALKRCPELQVLPYDFDGYRRTMQSFYRVLLEEADGGGGGGGAEVEAVSCDEAYLRVTWPTELAPDLASRLRSRIKQECLIDASIGMGPNRLVARLATRAAKPAGQLLVSDDAVESFMAAQRVKDLPGIGRAVLEKLSSSVGSDDDDNVRCSQLMGLSMPALQGLLGPRNGLKLFQSLRGIDDRPWSSGGADGSDANHLPASVGSEVSWGIRFGTVGQVKRFMDELSTQVWERLTTKKEAEGIEEGEFEGEIEGEIEADIEHDNEIEGKIESKVEREIEREQKQQHQQQQQRQQQQQKRHEITTMEIINPNNNNNNNSNLLPRKISLKLYRKKPDAGEPLKFLGRGHCDIFHRSRTLSKPLSTLSAMIDQVWALFEGEFLKGGLRVAVEDIRGVGVTLSDFGSGSGSGRGRGRKRTAAAEGQHLDLKAAFTTNSHHCSSFSSRIDPDVLKELPQEIQAEILNTATLNASSLNLPATLNASSTKRNANKKTSTNTSTNKRTSTNTNINTNTLTQLWGHRERRELESLHARIAALPQDPDLDKDVLLALPMDLQREIVDEWEQRLKRQSIRPTEQTIDAKDSSIATIAVQPLLVRDVLQLQVSFQGRSEWLPFELFSLVKGKVATGDAAFLQEVDDLLVELVLKECFKPVGELCSVLLQAGGEAAREIAEKIKRLAYDVHGFRLKV